MKTFLIVFTSYIMGISLIGYALPKMLESKVENNPFKYSHVLINN